MGKFIRKSFEIGRSPSPSPSRNRDVVYSYHAPEYQMLIVHPFTPLFSTSSMDHRVRTWDVRTMQNIGTQHGFTDGVLDLAVGADDGITQGAESGGIGAYVDKSQFKGYKFVGAGDEGVALVFRLL